MSAPAFATLLAALRRSISILNDRIESRHRRFALSESSCADDAHVVAEELTAAGRQAVFHARHLVLHTEKTLEADAEEVRVRAAQLGACAMILERGEEGEEEGEAATTARALLSCTAQPAVCCVALAWASTSLLHAAEVAVRVRDGIDPSRCTVSGDGIHFYQPGDNHVRLHAVDDKGDVVASIEADDVCVSMIGQGTRVTRVALTETGVVEVVYCVPGGCIEPLTLALSVCGMPLPGSPWSVVCLLGDSAVLAALAPERVSAFMRELCVWLPHRTYTLLYRGSRDGMTSASFHGLCDSKGPTLVLVRCDKGFVFGGYAGVSWETPGGVSSDECGSRYFGSPDTFVLSVFGPHAPGPVRFPALMPAATLYYDEGCGPVFEGGLALRPATVKSGVLSPTDTFDGTSYCNVGYGTFEDVLGKGEESLTGSGSFAPLEVEVFAVKRR